MEVVGDDRETSLLLTSLAYPVIRGLWPRELERLQVLRVPWRKQLQKKTRGFTSLMLGAAGVAPWGTREGQASHRPGKHPSSREAQGAPPAPAATEAEGSTRNPLARSLKGPRASPAIWDGAPFPWSRSGAEGPRTRPRSPPGSRHIGGSPGGQAGFGGQLPPAHTGIRPWGSAESPAEYGRA